MIIEIIKSDLALFSSLGLGILFLLVMGVYAILKMNRIISIPNSLEIEFDTIAGDDIGATQLDLAHAYIEANNKQQAKQILKMVAKRGNAAQKNEAKQLLKEFK